MLFAWKSQWKLQKKSFFPKKVLPPRQIKYPVNFDDELQNRRHQIRWYDLNNNESTTLLTFTYMKCDFPQKLTVSEQSAIQKRLFFEKSQFIFFLLSDFCTLFAKKRTFCYLTTFIESLITHKRFIFKESCISYGKRQKSCTLIVVYVKCLHLTSPIFNLSAQSNRTFYLLGRKYYTFCLMLFENEIL